MTARPKKIAVLGSTGVIGRYALELAAAFPDRFEVVGLAAGRNRSLLARQIGLFKPRLASIMEKSQARELTGIGRTKVLSGGSGLLEVAGMEEAELVVSAVVGFAGLAPTLTALEAGKTVALANKESLVAGGPLVMAAAGREKAGIIPVDSEISAVFQSLAGQRREDLRRILLTASGGPFRGLSSHELEKVTPRRALEHPNWEMGSRITIDSATLMNKGLEAIEALWLFDLEPDQISIHVHPTSILHSAVEFVDGSVVAQLAVPDMRLPVAYALAFPERLEVREVPPLDLFSTPPLAFEPPALDRFPCLSLALEAARVGLSAPAVLNAADEVAVEAFLEERIGFMDIPRVVEQTLEAHRPSTLADLDSVEAVDQWARAKAGEMV